MKKGKQVEAKSSTDGHATRNPRKVELMHTTDTMKMAYMVDIE